jgi:chlorite dismutase
VALVGPGDLMLVHFRPTLDGLAAARARLAQAALFDHLRPVYSFLSVAEAGLYHATAKLAKEAAARGGKVGDDTYNERLAQLVKAELESDHVKKRLYPTPPADMPYVCFYPMSKRRAEGQNWYEQSLEERSRMMYEHGLTGRRYSGRVFQVITGAMGLDAWEWGVTLFARDPLEFKKLVSEMRFDEASRRYAEFGAFYVGKAVGAEEAVRAIL